MSENVINDKSAQQYQTTDDSTQTILTYNLVQNFSGKINFIVVAKDINTVDTFVGEANFAIKRGDGPASILGEIIYDFPIQSDASMSTAVISPATSGSSLVMNITGIASKTIDWLVQISVDGIQMNNP